MKRPTLRQALFAVAVGALFAVARERVPAAAAEEKPTVLCSADDHCPLAAGLGRRAANLKRH
jgi:hypothetical protein